MAFFGILDFLLCLTWSVPIVLNDLRRHTITNSSLRRFGSAVLALKFVELSLGLANLQQVFLSGAGALTLFLILHWLSARALGLGDVKISPILAILAGVESLRNFFLWLCIIWLWGGVHASVSALRWHTFRRRIAFAPALFAGTLTYLAMGIWSSLPQ